MTIAIPQDKPLIAIYACGGTGYNLAKSFYQKFMNSELLSERVAVYFVDTSTANNNELNTRDNTMVVGSGEGSGKKRAANAEDIRESMPGVVQALKPGVFNILLGSASGGSGSTIMNELFRLMAIRDLVVFNMLIGSRSSRTEIENTDKTFATYHRVAGRYTKPALVHYRENSATIPRSETNTNLINNLSILCLFLSGLDNKMDITDIRNLSNYHTVTPFKPGVVGFDLFIDKFDPRPHEVLYAVGSIAREDISTDITPTPEYQAAGHANSTLEKAMIDMDVFHWAILGNSFAPLMDELSKKVAEFKKNAVTHVQTSLDRYATEDASQEDDDLVV